MIHYSELTAAGQVHDLAYQVAVYSFSVSQGPYHSAMGMLWSHCKG